MTYNAEGQTEKISSFTQLRCWQEAKAFAVDVYRLSANFPPDEKFGLTSQIRRSAVSISANIAEGFSRNGQREKINFYSISLGSLTETLSHAYIAQELKLLNNEDITLLFRKFTNLHKMINGMIKTAPGRLA